MALIVIVTMSVGWFVPKVILNYRSHWTVAILSLLVAWACIAAVVLGVVYIETEFGNLNAGEAFRRGIQGIFVAMPFSIFSTWKWYRSKLSKQ